MDTFVGRTFRGSFRGESSKPETGKISAPGCSRARSRGPIPWSTSCSTLVRMPNVRLLCASPNQQQKLQEAGRQRKMNSFKMNVQAVLFCRQIQGYCLAGGSWSTVGPSASALQEGPKPYSCLPNQQRGSPSWKLSKMPPRRQANRTA